MISECPRGLGLPRAVVKGAVLLRVLCMSCVIMCRSGPYEGLAMLADVDFREHVLLSLQFLPEDPIKANVGFDQKMGEGMNK